MKLKTLFISVLATLCMGMSACTKDKSEKPIEPPVSELPVEPSSEPVHEHAYGEWAVVTEPTCVDKGLEERVCECGEKEQREIDALGHLPKEEWEVKTEATVDAEGEEVLKCSRCGEILESRKIDKLEPVEDKVVISFAATSGSGEHDNDSLLALMNNELITAVSDVSKIYKSTGTSGAHPNTDGIIKTGTSKLPGTMKLTLAKAVKKLEISCHDFYAKTDAYPTNSNKITVNGIEQLAPYNAEGNAENLVWEFTEPVTEINYSSTRVYLWSMTFYF